jgi:hypothetical protein
VANGVCQCAGKPLQVKAAAGRGLPMQRLDLLKPARSVLNQARAANISRLERKPWPWRWEPNDPVGRPSCDTTVVAGHIRKTRQIRRFRANRDALSETDVRHCHRERTWQVSVHHERIPRGQSSRTRPLGRAQPDHRAHWERSALQECVSFMSGGFGGCVFGEVCYSPGVEG